MTAQDPELSAALGWPGGISDPVLDRTRLLQIVAALRLTSKQALEALTNCSSEYGHRCNRCDSEVDEGGKVASALRAALAQQAEPVQDSWFWGRVAARQASRIKQLETAVQVALEALKLCTPNPRSTDDDYAEQGWKEHNAAITNLRAALAQQDEPVDVGLLEYRGNSVAFIHQKMTAYRTGIDAAWDAFRANGLHPDGKTPLADMIAKHTAPPRRTMVPLTEEEIDRATAQARDRDAMLDHIYEYSTTAEGVLERIRNLCRAVEKASWEKNHGKA